MTGTIKCSLAKKLTAELSLVLLPCVIDKRGVNRSMVAYKNLIILHANAYDKNGNPIVCDRHTVRVLLSLQFVNSS